MQSLQFSPSCPITIFLKTILPLDLLLNADHSDHTSGEVEDFVGLSIDKRSVMNKPKFHR